MPLIILSGTQRFLEFDDFHAQISTGLMIELLWADVCYIVALGISSFVLEQSSKIIIIGVIIHAASLVLYIVSFTVIRGNQ